MNIQFFLSPGSRTQKAFNEAISSELLPSIEMVHAHKDTKPRHGHMVLVSDPRGSDGSSRTDGSAAVRSAGEGKPSRQIEAFAARIGAYCVCIPEAGEWLTQQIRERIELNLPLVMVDAALAGTNQYSGAK